VVQHFELRAGPAPALMHSFLGLRYILANTQSRPHEIARRWCNSRYSGPDAPASDCAKLDPMTLEDLENLLDYNYWARDRLLEAVDALTLEQFMRPLGSSFSSVRDTIAHICGAESIWLARWRGELPSSLPKPERIPDIAAARREWVELEAGMRAFVGNLGREDVERSIEYKDTRGASHNDLFWQMLQHVVNHGSYHRGQVTTMLRQMQALPPKSMDLIAYYRSKKTQA
jgi:uncharacterized damage-inducible protein DinB